MNYIEAMDYFYSIAPIKFGDAALYAILYATILISIVMAVAFAISHYTQKLKSISIPVIADDFISSTFSFALFIALLVALMVQFIELFGMPITESLIILPVAIYFFTKLRNCKKLNNTPEHRMRLFLMFLAVFGWIIIFMTASYIRLNFDNKISKESIVTSPYFESLDNKSKKFVSNSLILNNNSLFDYSSDQKYKPSPNEDVDISKISIERFSPYISIFKLKELIESEIEYRGAEHNSCYGCGRSNYNNEYKLNVIKHIQNAYQ